MNVDGRDSVFNSHICFNALATLQHIKNVENSCNFCSATDHLTNVCPVLLQGEHVKDTSIENLSRSSVPHGLQVLENETGTHIISVQKFARGCRFGPLLAPKSYVPIENLKFPLTISGTVNLDVDAMNMPELKELFKVRNIHLDTRNEKYCNWMIHVDPAQYANEQNLVAYEEDNEIFFAAVEDLDVGDILKVWYSPMYGERIKAPLLHVSPFPLMKNVLQQGGVILPEYQLFNNFGIYDGQSNRTEISLPSIKNIIKPSSYVCYDSRAYAATLVGMPSPYARAHIDQVDHDQSLRLESKILNLDEPCALATAHSSDIDPFGTSFEEEDDDHLRSADGNVAGVVYSNALLPTSDKEEKKIYPCQLCDKKYSTMTNIYRHVRAQHNYFLCSLCMKMFELEPELKEHIHKCPKSDVKKPQCIVCMQYFSNSWSLTRHIKIHVSAGECDADILLDRKIKEKKCKDDTKDGIDFSEIDKNSRESLVNDSNGLVPEPSIQSLPILCDFDVPIENAANTSFVSVAESDSSTSIELCGSDNEISTCIVCEKRFKSAVCMNKHLKSVHTVKVLTSIKRPATSSNHSKSSLNSSKRSQTGENHSSITHTGLPVNPFTAKALASKLNERNQFLNSAKNQTTKIAQSTSRQTPTGNIKVTSSTKEFPVPPLISLQTRSTGVENGQHSSTSVIIPSTTINSTEDYELYGNVPAFNIFKSNSTVTNDSTSRGNDSMADDIKMTQRMEKIHRCDLCGKKFNKKYELKRHMASHENITYKCPYCVKVVKRKSSILKHLRISHKELDHLWGKAKLIDSLKHVVIVDIDGASNVDRSDDASDCINHSNGDHSKIPAVCTIKSDTLGTNRYATTLNTTIHTTNSQVKNNSIAVNSKPKKSNAIINYLKKFNLSQMKKYLLKKQHKTTEQIKKKMKLSIKLSKLGESVIHQEKKIHTYINNNNSIEGNSAFSDEKSNTKTLAFDEFIANTPPLSPKLLTQTVLPLTTTDNVLPPYNGENLEQKSLTNMKSSPTSFQSTSQSCQQKSSIATGTEDENVNNIIDNCFFVDDTLNCNIVLHSPFSSDNDVDGFIMSNSIEGENTMNTELLNKFHDRLEEMEQKIDNSDFKVLWNEMLADDDNENGIDQMVDDDDDLNGRTETNGNGIDAIDDSNETNNADFNNISAIKQPINEFA